jgi:hypothetical protein
MGSDPAAVRALARRARNVVAHAILRASFLPTRDESSKAVSQLIDSLEPLHRLTW